MVLQLILASAFYVDSQMFQASNQRLVVINLPGRHCVSHKSQYVKFGMATKINIYINCMAWTHSLAGEMETDTCWERRFGEKWENRTEWFLLFS